MPNCSICFHANVEIVYGLSYIEQFEKKAVQELKQLVQEALNRHTFGVYSSQEYETRIIESASEGIEEVEPETESGTKEIEETIVSESASIPADEKVPEEVPENGVKLDFNPGGISTIVHVHGLKNSPGTNKRELRKAVDQALQLIQDNYFEFVGKQVFINTPWWYMAFFKTISPFLTQTTESKFTFARPSRSKVTLLKIYISSEQIPIRYCVSSKDILKPSAKHIVEFPVTQVCYTSFD
ncbi:hypothetical protein RD792_001307 [Penstemon davidsonii]|uniref:CRAL-TRIO domain-containing protein n=1 Tax=Penstemon davidsonii TaxID=160366 RepID=A0ABR0DND5_9LAMI|nr:hypothetical protein RD792_001307 [Penstemon davidsonii]